MKIKQMKIDSMASPVKVKLIKPESHAQVSLMDNENKKVGCTIVARFAPLTSTTEHRLERAAQHALPDPYQVNLWSCLIPNWG